MTWYTKAKGIGKLLAAAMIGADGDVIDFSAMRTYCK